MKYSKQRESLLEYLKSVTTHPTADDIYHHLRTIYPNISLGTVYRNLSQLTNTGQIIKVAAAGGREHFDASTYKHYHFICVSCDCVTDVKMPEIQGIEERVSLDLDAAVTDHNLVFYGKCSNCK